MWIEYKWVWFIFNHDICTGYNGIIGNNMDNWLLESFGLEIVPSLEVKLHAIYNDICLEKDQSSGPACMYV
jgi:hypothetical protein